MKIIQDRLVIVITLVVLIAGLIQTNRLLTSHFTHSDDIGVANTLLNWRLCDTLEEKREKYSTIPGLKLLYDRITAEPSTCKLLDGLYPLVSVPAHWTYAPAQFVFTALSLRMSGANSYEEVKYAGRWPSFVFYMVGLLGFGLLLRAKRFLDYGSTCLLAALLLLLGMSLELRVMAAQMESFAIAVFSGVLLVAATLSMHRNDARTMKSIFWHSLVLTAGITMQYQGLFLAVACVSALFLFDWFTGDRRAALRRGVRLAICMSLLSIFYLPFLAKNRGLGVNWNAGPGHEFIVTGNSVFERVIDLARLVVQESFYNVYSIAASVQTESIWGVVLGMLLTGLFVLGLLQLFQTRNDPRKLLILLILGCYVGVTGLLLLLGAISFGPTRHALYHLFPLLLGVAFGLQWLAQRFSGKWFEPAAFAAVLLMSVGSLVKFDDFAGRRSDPLSQALLDEYLSPADVDLIIGDGVELVFFDSTRDRYLNLNGRIQCDRFTHTLNEAAQRRTQALDQPLRLGIYTKKYPNTLTEATPLGEMFSDFARRCGQAKPQFQVSDIQRVHAFENPEQIDISMRTQNGPNALFLYHAKLDLRHE